jgi:hypothetical protein
MRLFESKVRKEFNQNNAKIIGRQVRQIRKVKIESNWIKAS